MLRRPLAGRKDLSYSVLLKAMHFVVTFSVSSYRMTLMMSRLRAFVKSWIMLIFSPFSQPALVKPVSCQGPPSSLSFYSQQFVCVYRPNLLLPGRMLQFRNMSPLCQSASCSPVQFACHVGGCTVERCPIVESPTCLDRVREPS